MKPSVQTPWKIHISLPNNIFEGAASSRWGFELLRITYPVSTVGAIVIETIVLAWLTYISLLYQSLNKKSTINQYQPSGEADSHRKLGFCFPTIRILVRIPFSIRIEMSADNKLQVSMRSQIDKSTDRISFSFYSYYRRFAIIQRFIVASSMVLVSVSLFLFFRFHLQIPSVYFAYGC